MTGRSGQMRQTTTAEARLDHGKAAGSGVTRPNVSPFGCPRVGCDRISLRRLDEANNCAQRSRIRGMSAEKHVVKFQAATCLTLTGLSRHLQKSSAFPFKKESWVSKSERLRPTVGAHRRLIALCAGSWLIGLSAAVLGSALLGVSLGREQRSPGIP
jgi:hypothetical protein